MPKDHNRRPFLALPAVHPSCSTSLFSLLDALVALVGEVSSSNRPCSFPVHVHQAIRRVELFLAFLEELRDCPRLPDSTAPSLCELHVAFQKLRLLLRDCSRRGARVRLLMCSDKVSDLLGALFRDVATALDVLLMNTGEIGGIPVETEELARLAGGQAKRAMVWIGAADRRAARDVRAVLDQFEKGVPPDRAAIQRVLDHLGIRSWADCNDEISFLEEEIGEGREAALLSGLMGLMLYARGVLFDVVDTEIPNSIESKPGKAVFDCFTPDEFRCPISLDLMTDPVTVSSGQTYNRGSIVRWLKAGNRTCPATGNKLTTTDLVPNHAVRSVLRQFCKDKGVPVAEPAGNGRISNDKGRLPGSAAATEATRMLLRFLVQELTDGSDEERSKALYEIRLLAKSSAFNRACLVEAGAVPWLLHFLDSWDPLVQGNAIASLLNLSKHPDGRKVIFESGGLVPVVDVLSKGLTIDAQQNAAAVLFYLSSVNEYRRTIGDAPEAIPTLVRLLKSGTSRGKKNAVVALFGLLAFPGHHRRALAAGAVPNLLAMLSSEREDTVGDSLAVLAALAERPEGAEAVLKSSGAIQSLVETLRSSTSHAAKEYCISTFLSICNNGGRGAVSQLNQCPALMPSLYTILTDGSPRASKKASSLISILHRSCEQQSTTPLSTPPTQQENVVPVW